jgi:putative two-component system response regulator
MRDAFAGQLARRGSRPTLHVEEGPPGERHVLDWLAASLLLEEDWDHLSPEARADLLGSPNREALLAGLIKHGLLTEYQACRIEAGKTHGLVLGNYRVLDRLGAGGMGIVFKAENLRMRRPVAIKVLALSHEQDPRLLQRFYAEVRAIAQLQHPNIVAASDDGPALHYLVMEYVPGQDLEEYVLAQGPASVAKACDIVHQVASALAEAHRHHLVHRDIKPSNVRLTPEGQAKLLDFGLTRHFRSRLTEPGAILGTLEYIAPEQARDASTVDIRADIYGLGGTLYFLLTGQTPFPEEGSITEDLARRLTQPPPSLRAQQPDLPAELDAVVARMMAIDQERRYQTPQEVMRALLPFLKPELREHLALPAEAFTAPAGTAAPAAGTRVRRILVTDDEPSIRKYCRYALQADDVQLDEAADGSEALVALRERAYDLVLLDIDMPRLSGRDTLTRLREDPPSPHLKVIMFSGRCSPDEMAQMLQAGADDYLSKPLSMVQLRARVRAALRLKEAQDRSDLLNGHLLAVNTELERGLNARDSDLVQARNALVMALAKLVEHRDSETGAHLQRMQRYSRCLAEEAAGVPSFAEQITPSFIDLLECCVPLHDIGKVGLPDHILLKPGKLTEDERVLMQTHTMIGADTLTEVARQHGFASTFLQMAADIARHHHERFDGTGYPDRLAGSAIPLAARLVALADVYDALRSRRVHKPALSHASALHVMNACSVGQFDPALVQVFQRCAPRFEQIFRELAE